MRDILIKAFPSRPGSPSILSWEFTRKILAVILVVLLPSSTLPVGARSATQLAVRSTVPQVLVPPGGLDELFGAVRNSNTKPAHFKVPADAVQSPFKGAIPSGAELRPTLSPALSVPALSAHGGFAAMAPLHPSPLPMMAAPSPAPPPTPSNVSTISSNFNGTSIAAGNYIWFNSVVSVSGLGSAAAKVYTKGGTIQFTANGTAYNLSVADTVILFSPSATSASTVFDAVNNQWNITVPLSFSGNVLLGGLAYPVSTALPGGICSAPR